VHEPLAGPQTRHATINPPTLRCHILARVDLIQCQVFFVDKLVIYDTIKMVMWRNRLAHLVAKLEGCEFESHHDRFHPMAETESGLQPEPVLQPGRNSSEVTAP
jgi:hypothetical protein